MMRHTPGTLPKENNIILGTNLHQGNLKEQYCLRQQGGLMEFAGFACLTMIAYCIIPFIYKGNKGLCSCSIEKKYLENAGRLIFESCLRVRSLS